MKKSNYVDPIIGTVGDEQSDSIHGGGKTHPGACVPGGMVQLSPDTFSGRDNGTGYNYCNNTIEGFSFNHMSGIGWYGDLGNLQIMPIMGEPDLRSGSNMEVPFEKGTIGWKSAFSHENEKASAGYYSVKLDRYNILAEATATTHTGMLRLTYSDSGNAGLIFNFSRRIAGKADFESVKITDNRIIEGYIKCTPANGGFGRGAGGIRYNLYFVCELSKKAKEMRFFENEEYKDSNLLQCEGEDLGLVLHFGDMANKSVTLKCGISYVDMDGARNNLAGECTDFDFDKIHSLAEKQWENALDIIDIEGDDETDKTLFYTCLYHTLMDPRTAVDADGRFSLDGKEMRADYTHRTMFSGWDVYRSEFPLLTLIRPDIVNDEANSLLKIAEYRNSSFPKWELMGIDSRCMVGDPGLIVIADAYAKGIRGFDGEKAYEIATASSKSYSELNGKHFSSLRPDSPQYKDNAFVVKSLSSTLEFLLADFAMSKFALSLGKTDDAKHYENRSRQYFENFNKESGFMAPRNEDGSFVAVKDEYAFDGCVESNIFQQSWFVPYDVKGLCDLFGRERATALLEKLFDGADLTALWNEDYNHSNEPCHNITHYFNILGLCHRTQYWTRRVQKEAYRLGAFGFCGNEDVGQLSAWYVLSAVGFAQVCPGDDKFFVNTPLFKKAKIKLDSVYHSCKISDTLEIACNKDPLTYPYIEKLILNGKEISRSYVTYSELTSGGKLEFILSENPCTDFASDGVDSFFEKNI